MSPGAPSGFQALVAGERLRDHGGDEEIRSSLRHQTPHAHEVPPVPTPGTSASGGAPARAHTCSRGLHTYCMVVRVPAQ